MSIETVQAPAPAAEAVAPVVTTEEKIQRAIAAADAKEGTTPTESESRKSDEPDAEAPSEGQPSGDLTKAMKLLKSGDEIAAIKELMGDEGVKLLKLDSKSWKAFRHQRDQIRARAEQAETAAQTRLAEAQQLAREVYTEAAPLMEARKAFESGDYVEAFAKAFGVDINEFQRMALRQKQGQDPQVAKLQKELTDFKRSAEEQQNQARSTQQEQEQRAQVERYEQHVQEAISQFPGLSSALARNRYFRDDVTAELQSAYDHRTRTTIPITEAIESVSSRDEWAAMRTGERRISGNTVRADNPAQPSRRMARPLNQRNAASAAASGPPLRGAALIAHFRRLHDSGALG